MKDIKKNNNSLFLLFFPFLAPHHEKFEGEGEGRVHARKCLRIVECPLPHVSLYGFCIIKREIYEQTSFIKENI
jgi:hypothetical protein